MDSARIALIARDTLLPEAAVVAAVALFDKGYTVPFVARYRREAIGGLNDEQVIAIHERFMQYREMLDRRDSLLKMLAEQGKLTDRLRERIENCNDRFELEDIFLLHRPRRKSRATEAVEKGLEPLAEFIYNQDPDAWTIEEHAGVFVDAEKGGADVDQALRGAADIIAEWIAECCEYRRMLRDMLWKEGHVVSTVVPAKAEQKTKYNMYYNRREPVSKIPSHRVLAIRRGSKEGILTSSIQGDNAASLRLLMGAVIKDPESPFAPILEAAVRDAYFRILRPLIETEVRAMLKQRADREAIRVFRRNLENLLLCSPAGPLTVIGVEPVKAGECKLAAVDGAGKLMEEASISPLPPPGDLEGSRNTLRDLIARNDVKAIAIGAGNNAREAERVIRQILADERLDSVTLAAVNDAGIPVYASSRIAREEFPEASVATRAAVSIARRLQDPLAELVKIDPKLIGVGQYQHDVDQKELHRSLMQTVQSCVNRVGVNPNTADVTLLRYVAGLNERLAQKIVDHRAASGPFKSRSDLTAVPGLGEFTYYQAAGFLRIPTGDNPLDATAIHPEFYPIVEAMAAAANISVAELIGNAEAIESLKLEELAGDSLGNSMLMDIREELLKPGNDPRRKFAAPRFRTDVQSIADLQVDMVLEGVVTNVTNFGAFVDIGIQQDGLVHLSQISNRFIRDPREAVSVGDIVQVKVISVEADTRRIGLSIKALLPPRTRRQPKMRRRPGRQSQSPSDPPNAGITPNTDSVAAPPPQKEQTGRQRRPRPSGRYARRRRNGPRPIQASGEPAPQPEQIEQLAEPAEPERTLQEKIVLLQTKFRGIN